jgi:predicted neuraminidase
MRLQPGRRAFLVPEGHGGFAQCHASTLAVLPSGDLLVAFFAGAREAAADSAIWLSRRQAGSWAPPRRLLAEPGLPHWNPVLHAEGERVWLFHKVGATVHDWATRIATSDDGGVTWSDARPLVAGETAPRGPVKNKLIVLADGDWLAPGSIEDDRHWDAFVDRSPDRGRSWTRTDIPLVHRDGGQPAGAAAWRGLAEQMLWESDPARTFAWDGVIQPSLWQSDAEHVHMLLRSTRGRIYRSDSADAGRRWTEAYPTELPNNNSGLDLVRLADGGLVLACNPVAGNWASRSPLSLLTSSDEGRSWARGVPLETADGEFSYPALVADGGRLHVTYTWNRSNIVHREITLPAAAAGEASPDRDATAAAASEW